MNELIKAIPSVLLFCLAGTALAEKIECDPDNGGIELPEGFCALVVADDLGRARHLTVRDNGDVYVALHTPSQEGGIVALRDTTGDGKADVAERFSQVGGTGIGIHEDYLYFGSDATIFRYSLAEDELRPSGMPETVVGGFPLQDQHTVKPFTFDGQGWIYVDVGAPSNACQQETRTPGSRGMKPCPQLERQAGIWRFKADQLGQKQQDGEHYATGIRHSVALDWHPRGQNLYVVQHGRDQLHEFWPDLFTVEQNAKLPAEEFLVVGQDSDFGWPYCYYDHLQGKRVLAPEYGGDGNEVGQCDQYGRPIMAFPAHWAPNDLLFYTGEQFPERYRGGAFIAFHGSWNRAPLEQQGYKVVFVPFAEDGGLPAGDWEVFANGFAGVEVVIERPKDARYRPMGLAQGPDGSLYISDSQQGRIWRVIYIGTE